MSEELPALPPEIAALLDEYQQIIRANGRDASTTDGWNTDAEQKMESAARTALETAITALVRDGERWRAFRTLGKDPDVMDSIADATLAASTPTPKG